MNPPSSSVVDMLERFPALLGPLVREAPRRVLKKRPAESKWSIHEHVCHLVSIHPVFEQRLALMVAEDHPSIVPFDPGDNPPDARHLEWPTDDVLERFEKDRRIFLRQVRGITADDWARTAEHPEYSSYSVYIMLRHLTMHDMLHAYRIEELVYKRDW